MKRAFTLAEVLITLGVIGVVAAIILPTVIQKHKEHELVQRYKRIYSTLNQAYTYAVAEYGTADTWDSMYSTALYNKIKPFLKIAYDCPVGADNKLREKCIYGGTYWELNYHYDLTGGEFHYNISKNPMVKLVSGESIIFAGQTTKVQFIVDINGDKKPNKLGVDMHFFSFSEKDKYRVILPGADWESGKTDQATRCDITRPGVWSPGCSCGYWILKYNNMDYLHISRDELVEKW